MADRISELRRWLAGYKAAHNLSVVDLTGRLGLPLGARTAVSKFLRKRPLGGGPTELLASMEKLMRRINGYAPSPAVDQSSLQFGASSGKK